MLLKSLNTYAILLMMFFFAFLVLFFSGFLEFPSVSTAITPPIKDSGLPSPLTSNQTDPFTDLFGAFRKWDSLVGCARFREKHKDLGSFVSNGSASLQVVGGDTGCDDLKMDHVSVLVKGWTWIPDNLDNLYSCRCGLSCLWTKSSVLADKPDALLFETTTPPIQRRNGDPLRVYMDLEAGRRRSGFEDIFISYHAEDDVQSTYAGALFHNGRNYHVSSWKKNVSVLLIFLVC
uniref:Alpha 1 family protein n=1 Tax=Rhizophora mucronata TaxID=61149 RepID=A0A2P2JQ03_RHIMU